MASHSLAGSDNRSGVTSVSNGSDLRRFGISLVGEIPWGTHLCQFYQTSEDLIDILVPYFVEGLKSNEFCMWVTSPPLEVEDAKRALGEALPDLDVYVRKGQIEILSYRDWYLLGGSFDSDRVLQGWVQKERDALSRGFEGLRLTGNTFWVERNDWKSFTDYEAAVNDVLPSHRMIALCTYSLDRCVGSDVVDVVRNHVGTLIRKGNTWCLVEDVAKRRKMEDELRESQTKYKDLTETTGDFVWEMDSQGKYTYCSPQMEKLWGIKPEEMIGRTPFDLMPANVREKASEFFMAVINSPKPFSGLETAANVDQGRLVFIETSGVPFFDNSGKLLGFRGISRDITERKKAEEALVKAEAHYHALFDNIDEGFQLLEVMRDEKGEPCDFRYIELNNAYETQTGRKVSDVLGKTTSEVYPGSEKYWLDVFSGVEKTGSATRFENYSEPLGKYFETYAFPFGKDHVGVLFRNITERKKAEEEIRSLSRFPYENPNIVLRISNDGKALFSNPAGLTALNAWKTEVGRTVPDDWRKLVAEIARAGTKKELEEKFDTRTFLLMVAPVSDAGYVNVYGRDITERKRAEQALRDSQRDLNRAQEVAKTGSWRLDVQQNKLLWSDETYRMFGIPPGTPMTYNSFLAVVHPEDREYVDQRWQAALRGEPYDVEHRIVVNSEAKWVREIAELETDEKGSLMGGFGTVQDITERKEMENALRETSEYLDSLLNYANAPIIVWNPESKITKFNHAFERLTGFKADEVAGRDLSILFPEQTREKSLTEIIHTLAGEYWEVVEIPILRKDSEVRTVLWNSANIYAADGKTLTATIAQGQDITERKKAEETLRETRDYLDSLLNYASAPIIVWDTTSKITRFNHAFEHLAGYTAREVVGKDLSMLFPPESIKESLTEIQHTLTGEQWESMEIPILRKDSEVRTVLWNSANILDNKGEKIIATIAQGQDITENKKAEEALKASEEQLRRAIEDAPIPVIMHAEDGQVLQLSKTWTTLTGFSISDIPSFDAWLTQAVYGEGANEVRDHIHELFKGTKPSIEVELPIRTIEGTLRYWSFSASSPGTLRDGRRFIVGMALDITERKKLEEQLRKAERLAAIGETAAIVGHDLRNPLQAIVGFIGLAEEQLKAVESPEVKKQKIMWPLKAITQQAQYMNKIVLDLQDYARTLEPELEKTQLADLVKQVLLSLQIPPTIETSMRIPIKFPKASIDRTLMTRALTNLLRNAIEAMPKGGKLTIKLSHTRGEFSIEIKDTGVGIPEENMPRLFTPLFTTKAKGQGFGLAVTKQIIEAHEGTITVKSKPHKGSTFTIKIPQHKGNQKRHTEPKNA